MIAPKCIVGWVWLPLHDSDSSSTNAEHHAATCRRSFQTRRKPKCIAGFSCLCTTRAAAAACNNLHKLQKQQGHAVTCRRSFQSRILPHLIVEQNIAAQCKTCEIRQTCSLYSGGAGTTQWTRVWYNEI